MHLFFLSKLAAGGDVLDAACGTGKYFGLVLDSGRHVTGVDHSRPSRRGTGEVPASRYSRSSTSRNFLPRPVRRGDVRRRDGVRSPGGLIVLANFRSALRPVGWLYLTIELVPEEEIRAANEAGRRSGLPLVSGEVIWDDPDGAYYHHYPSVELARSWLADAGFEIGETEGPG